MGMAALTPPWHTPASVRTMPDDGNRYECVAGELLVTPSPRWPHQELVLEFMLAIQGVRQVSGLRMLTSPSDVELRDDTLVQPDLFVYRWEPGKPRTHWRDIKALELVIEILSPSTARYDRVVKRRFYQEVGVPEYWIVDADARVVERWRPADERPEICAALIEWLPAGAPAPIVVDLPALFAQALDS